MTELIPTWLYTRFATRGMAGLGCLLILAALSAAAQKAASSTTHPVSAGVATYRIAGTLINSATGEPVARATVSLLSIADSRTIQATLTGDDGHFVFSGLTAAKLQLSASRRGYSTSSYNQHDDYFSAIVTGEGQQTESLVFRISPAAVLHGTVTDENGDPVESANVMLFLKPRGHNPGDRIVRVDSTATDDSGNYEFANLAAGEYLLAAKAEPWYALYSSREAGVVGSNASLDLAYPVSYFDSTTNEASASSITLAAGNRIEANLALHALPALRLQVDLTSRKSGSTSAPELRQSIFGTATFLPHLQFIQDGNKSMAEYTGLAPGHYQLEFREPPGLVDLDLTASRQIDSSIGNPAATVSGAVRILPASNSASKTEASAEINLTLTPLSGATSQNPLSATVHKDRFSFTAVPPGEWVLSASKDSKVLQVLSITAEGKSRTGSQLTVRDRVLSVAVVVAEGATRVEGFARKDGQGFGGAMIVLVPEDPAANTALFRRDQSDSDGSFAFLNALPGKYTAVAIEDGWELDWERPEVMAHYLSRGVSFFIGRDSGPLLRLSEPVPVQPR